MTMWEPVALKAEQRLIPYSRIKHLEIDQIENGIAVIVTHDGERYTAYGIDAVEAVWAFKPSAVEGRRLKWKKGAWAFHNIVAHPVLQILAWVGLARLGIKFHDFTTPVPRGFRS